MHVIGRGNRASETYPQRVYSSPATTYDTTLYATQFGADPTGTTDSTAALNEFLLQTGLQKRRGRIPAGTYLISGTLYTHNTNTGEYFTGGVIEGDGRELTILRWAGDFDTGVPMMVWSRIYSVFRDISFEGEYGASLGLVIQNAQVSKISVNIFRMFGHGIAIANEWPDAGLTNGFNEELVIDQPRVDNCGYTEIQQILLYGTGLGGTFTLTFDGNTTAPIAWNADAATIAAALVAANPDLDSPPVDQGGTGANPFDVTGTLDTHVFIELKGLAAGHHDTITMDTSGITGTITAQQTALSRRGSAANGIHFYNKDDPQANHDNATLTIFEPACRQNGGAGIYLVGYDVKVWGGQFEGNVMVGIMLTTLQPSTNAPSVGNTLQRPYFENNHAAGLYISYTAQSWLVLGVGSQSHYAATGNDAALIPGYVTTGGVSVVEHGPQGMAVQIGGPDGVPIIVGQNQIGTSTLPLEIHGVYDGLSVHTISGDGPFAIDLTGVAVRTSYQITLDGNITSLTVTGAPLGMILILEFVRGPSANTVAWPATWRFAGGAPPVLGSGSQGSVDIVAMQQYGAAGANWIEVWRNLGVE